MDLVLDALLAKLTDADTVGFLLTGSYARGDATPFSDVDLIKFTNVVPTVRSAVRYEGGRLVTISITTVDDKMQEMSKPETAIWAVPGIRQAKVLADSDGSITALKAAAQTFEWTPLQPAANHYACNELAGLAEEVQKILAALNSPNDEAAVYASLGLVLGLTKVIAVKFGVLIESENLYFAAIREEIGADSEWSELHRIASGSVGVTSIRERVLAALRLYVESARLLDEIEDANAKDVVEKTIQLIAGEL